MTSFQPAHLGQAKSDVTYPCSRPFGAGLTPELGGAGALPGAVLGFVGGFAQGLLEAPVEAAAKGALECSEDVPAWLKP